MSQNRMMLYEEYTDNNIEWTDQDGRPYTIFYLVSPDVAVTKADGISIVRMEDEIGNDVTHKLDMLIPNQEDLLGMIQKKEEVAGDELDAAIDKRVGTKPDDQLANKIAHSGQSQHGMII